MRPGIKALLVSVLLLSLQYEITADELAEETLEEIIVRADLRERTQNETPFSVSVLDAAFISATTVQHVEELVNVVPNMNWSGDGHRARYFQIRGVGELEQYQGAPNPSIGFIIDDIDFSGIGSIATLFDVESVEVLRGPQGSRYGANALGGLIYVRSATPAAEDDGRLQFSLGNDGTRSLAGAFGGALGNSDTTTFRVSAEQYESDGFRSNTYLGRQDTNGRDELSVRGRLHYQSGDAFAAKIAVLFSDIDNGYDAFALDNSYTMLSDRPGQDAQQSLGASARLEWDLANELTVTSITSMASSDIRFSFDADWGNSESWAPFTYDYVTISERERRTISQEIRVGNEQWVVGLYTLGLSEDLDTLNQGDYFDPFFNFADSLNDSFNSEYESRNLALFGQASFDLSDKTELSTGLRIERRTTDYVDSAGIDTGPSESFVGGELSLHHAIGDSTNVYLTVARGYKAGGFNLGPTPAGKRNFDEEVMWTVEAGAKATLIASRLHLNAALFSNRRSDQQVRTATQLIPGDPASFVFFTDNVGKGEGLGAEVDIRFDLNDAWRMYASVGWLDATIDGGRQQAHAPEFTFAGGIEYQSQTGVFARLDASAKDAFYFDVSHDQVSKPFELLNARVGYETEAWKVSLWARNVLDEEYAVRGFYFGNEPPNFADTLYTRLGDPRHYGATVEWRF